MVCVRGPAVDVHTARCWSLFPGCTQSRKRPNVAHVVILCEDGFQPKGDRVSVDTDDELNRQLSVGLTGPGTLCESKRRWRSAGILRRHRTAHGSVRGISIARSSLLLRARLHPRLRLRERYLCAHMGRKSQVPTSWRTNAETAYSTARTNGQMHLSVPQTACACSPDLRAASDVAQAGSSCSKHVAK